MKLKKLFLQIGSADYSGRKKVLIHCIFWVLWFGFIWFYTPNNFLPSEDILELNLLITFRDWCLTVSFFYVSSMFIFPQLSEGKFFIPLIVISISYFVIYAVTYCTLIYYASLFPNQRTYSGYAKFFAEKGFWKSIYARFGFWFITFWYALYFVVPLIIKLMVDIALFRVKNLELERNNIRLELDYLKSQVNPHFLFNTLNGVYSLVVDSEPKAAEIILKLSDLMRYSLYEANSDQVALHREVKFIQDYVSLERNRHKASTQILLEISGDTGDLQIPPLLLVTFVENAFKHGINNTIKASWIKIDLSIKDAILSFDISNSKSKKMKSDVVQGGIGLWNVKKRLDILYPNRHSLEIKNSEDVFSVNLKIQLS
ncbi:histidine kinase [Emticicia aquatilis]|uniref:Histidine kinase n=1 Tax=Emticicia aquatilis TaxID=1537369 RepID=A0A916Z3J1_9BACT|nr:sensor histidine kinase [Emticicia aquatilis]GGD74542.1 histidine kinase [Emticicia aquatilis]